MTRCVKNLKNATHARFDYTLPGYSWARRAISLCVAGSRDKFYQSGQKHSVFWEIESEYNTERLREVRYYNKWLNDVSL
jgi:hypothetical protein